MSDLNKMTGTPWHIEKMHRQDGDERRHRSRCIYYENKSQFCKRRMLKCIGSAHCPNYKEEKTETVIKNVVPNKYSGAISNTQKNEIPTRNISAYISQIPPLKVYIAPIKTIQEKREKIAERITGYTYVLKKDFFSSTALWDRYQYLLCCLEEKIIDCRLAHGNEKLQSEIRKEGMTIIQKIYDLICKETKYNAIVVQKLDFKFINNFYYPIQSFESVKMSVEKCIYYRLNGETPKIR